MECGVFYSGLEGGWSGIDEFKENMDMEQFKENCPLLFEFFTQACRKSRRYSCHANNKY